MDFDKAKEREGISQKMDGKIDGEEVGSLSLEALGKLLVTS